MTSFAPIHNHSEYSALDGLSTPREIAERCQCIGCTAAGITDHGTVAGHLEFGKVMVAHGIKPIFGCELYHGTKTEFGKNERDQAHFVAGAMTDEGLRNLWRLVDVASTNYRYVGRVTWEMLSHHHEGLFATSACIQGLVGQGFMKANRDPYEMVNRYLEIFRDNFYIEIHTYPGEEHERLNHALVTMAWERGIPLIYATDAHFAGPDQYRIHDAFVAMQTGENILMAPEDRKMWHPKALYIQDENQIRESLSYLPTKAIDEALANSAALTDKCNASLPDVRRHMPTFVPGECPWATPEEKQYSAAQMFVGRVEQGLIERYGSNASEEVWDRASYELETLLGPGLEHYFLHVWDFCAFCDSAKIKRGPGRGSAAGSIVAYALKITDIDPLYYDLIFERFYNPGREKGFPDIDCDFPVAARKKVRQYIMDRVGAEKVRTIGTTMRMKPKAVADRTYKACGITWDEKEELKRIIDKVPDIDILGADSIGWAADVDPGKTIYVMHSTPEAHHDTGDQILAWVQGQPEERVDIILQWLDILAVLCSRVAGYGVHPSGVVVSDVPLDGELPCMYNRSQEVQVTCFSMADVDARKFLKDDLLGLRNLDTLDAWEQEMGLELDWHEISQEEHPEEMWQLLDQGLTLGIFQIEKGYARRLCKEFKPRSIEDLGIIVALNRPGPIRSGAPDSFIIRRHGGEDDQFDGRKIELLAPILDSTFGWFLYQEQIIRFFGALGYNEGDADAVRKILGKKKPEAMRDLRHGDGEWENKGYLAAAEAVGWTRELADVVWSKIEDFAKYSFNKSHAIAYGTVAFRTLYAKWRGTPEFIISCIRTNPDDAGDYVSEGRRMDVKVFPPDILRSEPDIAVIDGDILFGFSNIKGIGKGAAKYLCELRSQHASVMSKQAITECIEANQEEWELRRDKAKDEGLPFKDKSPRQQFQTNKVQLLEQVGAFDPYEARDISLPAKQKLEKELLQVILTDDCEEVFAAHHDELYDLYQYSDLDTEDWVVVPGVVATIDPKKTKKDGKAMGIVTIEYQGEQCEFVVFPREWASYRFLWKERTPGIFTLVKTDRGVRFDKAIRLT